MNGELELRDPELYPESLKEILKLVTINETPLVVGSSAYTIHKYPSDVDVFEKVRVDLPREEAAFFYRDQFRTMFERLIINRGDSYITDFKAGEDARFSELGTENEIIERLSRAKLLTRELLDTQGSYRFWEVLRQLRIIRWSSAEVLSGIKKLPGGLEIRFPDAVSSQAIVKLDIVVWISGRFQAVEVFYNLGYKGGEFFPLGSYVESLLQDIEKYSSPETYAPLKLVKRIWSLSRVTDCQDMLNALNPLLSSNVAALNPIRTDIETIDLIIRRPLPDYQIIRMFTEILGFHKRITNHLTGENYLRTHLLIDKTFHDWNTWHQTGKLDIDHIMSILNAVSDILRVEINKESASFLKMVDSLNIKCTNPRFQSLTGPKSH